MSLLFSSEHDCFRNQYSMPLEKMFGYRNVHKVFSALNFSIICIKTYQDICIKTSNLITQPFQYPF